MTDRIRVSGIEVRARHGVLDAEKRTDQPFVVDIEVFLDLGGASVSDDLDMTVDYGELASKAHRYVAENTFDLIERVAGGLAELILEDPKVQRTVVTVHKPEAPIEVDFADVSVRIDRAR